MSIMEKNMSTTENKRIVNAVFPPAWNEGNFIPADKYIAADIVDNFDHSRGIESFKGVIKMFRRAFPDVHVTVIDNIAEGDKVVHQWVMAATHQGEFMGIHPTGKRLTWTGITIVRFANGKIVERWANVDVLGILQQLGAVSSQPEVR
jgi:predicted ester cyclase